MERGVKVDTGIDFSAGWPSPESVLAAGHKAVICYVSDSRPGTNFGAKPLTRDWASRYQQAGVEVVSCYQFGKGDTSDWLGGYDAGVKHARRALELHFAAGGPPRRPIYMPCDSNPSLDQWNRQASPFFKGCCDVIGLDMVGIYGNSLTIAWAIQDNVAMWFMEHNWGGDGANGHDPAAHLHQVEIDKRTVGGVGVDLDVILKPDYGQWSLAGAQPQQPQGVPMPPRRAMWSPNCDDRPRNVTWLCFHTQEGNGTADSLARYLDNPASGVSYNTVGDGGELIDVVPFDRSPWAALGANGRADHFCFGGSFSAWSRQQWLDCGMLDNAAAWLADRAAVRGLPIAYVGTDGVRTGTPGVIGHVDWTRGAGEGSHTDPGPNFPWDELIARAQRLTTTTPGVDVTPDECRQAIRDVLNEQAPSRVPGSTVSVGLGDCMRNADAASFIALHAVTDPITSGVAGSTVQMSPQDVWRNAEANSYLAAVQQGPVLLAAVQALADKYTAVGPAPVPATDVAAALRDVLATLTLNAKVA